MTASYDTIPPRGMGTGANGPKRRMHRQMASPRLGSSVKSARERLGWSREALAYHSGLSWAAITQIESGRRREVRVSSLVALSSALGVSVDYLVGGAANASPGLLNHRVLSYGSDDAYLAAAVPFLLEGLERDECVMAVTTNAHIGVLRDALGSNATHVEFQDASEWYVSLLGAASRYRTFAQERFERGAPWIRIIGEPVWGGWSDEETTEWFRYEAMINLSFASSPRQLFARTTRVPCPRAPSTAHIARIPKSRVPAISPRARRIRNPRTICYSWVLAEPLFERQLRPQRLRGRRCRESQQPLQPWPDCNPHQLAANAHSLSSRFGDRRQ